MYIVIYIFFSSDKKIFLIVIPTKNYIYFRLIYRTVITPNKIIVYPIIIN